MGCDIHIITEIKKDNKWERVKEIPDTLDVRNYNTFAVLANVRNNFNTKSFPVKGVPKDISSLRYDFESAMKEDKKWYENNTTEIIKMPDGTFKEPYSSDFDIECSKEQYDEWKGGKGYISQDGKRIYHISDPSASGGVKMTLPYKEIYSSFEEYWNKYHSGDKKDPYANDYGYWKIDFSEKNEDWHSHNYITLQEFKDWDWNDYISSKCKVPLAFYRKFIEFGGELPKEMNVIEEYESSDIREIFQRAFSPDVIISWIDKAEDKNLPIFKGIQELEDIAKKYKITDYNNIRIVFAFDN